MANIREIAERAQVAPGTVSRALNNKGYISKETRKKIDKALKELEYVPNELARNLYRNRSNMIGVILPDIEHPFFLGIIKKLVIELKKYNYGVALWTTEYEAREEKEYLERLKRNAVDAAVVFVPVLDRAFYQELGRPLVLLDRIVEGIPYIPIDQEKSGRLAARKLYEDGCRHVLTVVGEQSDEIPSLKRHVAFIKEMEKLGGTVKVIREEWNNFELDYHMELAEKILEQEPEADGIYAADILGTAFLKVLRRMGRNVPEEFEIISTDGIDESNHAAISLSAVIQPAEMIAKEMARVLMGQIEGHPVKKIKTIDVYMYNGDTTK
ncbi:MAG TPA: LacI family DNA-binding transcriptional regulator [Candidatus Limivivens merdigallinarum]|uniref:LacI family DNA-binding transcriptional regulator n=1 Tax=Candidatus Limivivens merdigallinarum TaxID=2840859 RepID=A0A9D1D0N4_9FIRM|nr:LacI family DNA-binding transcriptional regulator [Candidatus Limivivens merdigallinarum]